MTTAAAADSAAHSRSRAPSAVAASPSGMCTQHDQPQPARLRHQHLGRRRGDQAVDQHDSAVGDRAELAAPAPRAPPRPGAATRRAPRARAPTSRPRPARRRPAGRRRCRRSAAPGRRCRPARRRARRSQRPLVAGPRDVRLVQRDRDRRPGPRRPRRGRRRATRSASRSATTRASTSVVVFVPGERGLVVEVAVGQLAERPRAAPRRPARCRRRCRRRRGPRAGTSRRRRRSRRAGAAPGRTPRRAGCGRPSCGRGRSR